MRFMHVVVGGLWGLCLLAGCNNPSAGTGAVEARNGFIRGTARVITVDEPLGQALLDINGERVYAYWQKEAYAAQPGSITRSGPLHAPMADYHEAEARPIHFPAQAGQAIEFVGLRTRNEIFLRGVALIGK